MNLLPTSALVAAARHQAETVDFTTSNLRGAPFPLFFGGAQIVENYPVGPLAGTAFNLTVLSYAGELHLGLLADSAAIADPEALRDALADAFEDLFVETSSSDGLDSSVRTSRRRSATSLVDTSWRSRSVPRP